MDDKLFDANEQTPTAPDENAETSAQETTADAVSTDTPTDTSESGRHHSGHHHHHHSSQHGSGHHHSSRHSSSHHHSSHHGSGHHGSGRHSSSRHHSSKKRRSGSAKYLSPRKKLTMWLSKHISKKKVMRQNIIAALLALVVIGLLVYIGTLTHRPPDVTPADTETTEAVTEQIVTPTGDVIITIPYLENVPVVDVRLTDALASMTNGQTILEALRAQSKDTNVYRMLPVALELSEMAVRDGVALTATRVEVAKDAAFTAPRTITVKANQTQAHIDLLETGAKYYYRVYFAESDVVAQGSFTTAAGPRVLTIANIVNVRDIGGWTTVHGKRVRQGLLYRGSEMDGAVVEGYYLQPDGRRDMLEVLGIRFDMDLRGEYENTGKLNALGEGVGRTYYDMKMYNEALNSKEGREAIRRVFADLANPENYPIYLHCTYGCDRTGTVSYLLEAVLGLSDEDLLREYELSSLGSDSVYDRNFITPRMTHLANYAGNTEAERVENYLLSIGVTVEQLETIRVIFLEDIPTS